MAAISIHAEVWIASRLLSCVQEHFSKQEIMGLIKGEFEDERPGVSVHVSSVCVANKSPNHPVIYNYLYSVARGAYRILKTEDEVHPDRIGAATQPSVDEIPSRFMYLLNETFFTKEPREDSLKLEQGERYIPLTEDVKPIDMRSLIANEREAIEKTLLMMAYNPSCARIFSRSANRKNKEIIYSFIGQLPTIKNQLQFDKAHKSVLDRIVDTVENTSRKGKPKSITYGQAQKGLNVFLKVFIDWANLPSITTAGTVRNLLHCPLDSVVMKSLKSGQPALHRKHGSPPYTMKGITKYDQYIEWQKIVDEIIMKNGAEKRTLINVIWYLKSQKGSE